MEQAVAEVQVALQEPKQVVVLAVAVAEIL
jgi:hypothetical protein